MDVHVHADMLMITWSVFIACFIAMNLSLQWTSKTLPNILHELTTYGRLRRDIKSKWGQSLSVRKKWFTIFYAWGLLWNSVILYYYYSYKDSNTLSILVKQVLNIFTYPNASLPRPTCCCTSVDLQILLALLLVCIQTGRRLLECMCVTVFSEKSDIHLSHFIFGVFFYTALGPGILQQLHHKNSSDNCISSLSITMVTPYQIAAITLFIWSSWHQYVCHKILAKVRISSSNNRLYSIPYGDWFQYISSPHYLAEILIYISICLSMQLSNIYCLLSLMATLMNLLYTSRLNHHWYLRTFSDYPKRWTLIPFVI